MLSEEGEKFEFQELIKPEGAVEIWMNKVEQEMKQSLHKKMKEGIFYFSKMDRKKWLMESLGMISIGASQVWWTWRVEDVFSRVKLGNGSNFEKLFCLYLPKIICPKKFIFKIKNN